MPTVSNYNIDLVLQHYHHITAWPFRSEILVHAGVTIGNTLETIARFTM